MPQKNETDFEIDYVSKCAEALSSTTQSMTSSALLLIILSFMMVAVASGLVSVDQELSVAGLKLVAPSWLILVGGGWSIAGIYSHFVGLKIREAGFIDTIHRLYKRIGYSDESFTDTSKIGPFAPANVIEIPLLNWENETSFFGKLLYVINSALILVLMFLLPIAVQIFIAYKLISLFGWRWWVLISSLILVFVTVGNAILCVKKLLE